MTPAVKRLLSALRSYSMEIGGERALVDDSVASEWVAAIEAEASVDGFREGLEHAKATYVPDAIAAERARIRAAVNAYLDKAGARPGDDYVTVRRYEVLAAIEGGEA